MSLTQKIAALAVAQIEFSNKALEARLEAMLTDFGELHRTALELDQIAASDENALNISEGIFDLANTFGTAFKNLSEEQKQAARDAVAKIVTGANETLIERLFDNCLQFISGAQTFAVEFEAAVSGDE